MSAFVSKCDKIYIFQHQIMSGGCGIIRENFAKVIFIGKTNI